MAVDYSTTQLISDIKRVGSVPTNQALFDETDFLAFANDCMRRLVVPRIQKTREEYFVHEERAAANGRVYEIPSRTIGGKVRQVQILDENNHVLVDVPRLEPQLAQATNSALGISSWQNVFGYFFQDNNVHFTNDPEDTGPTVAIKFYRRPGKLVEVSECALVVSVSGADVTVSTIPASFAIGTLIDAIAAQPPFSSRGDGIEITNIAGSVITLSEEVAVVAGDYLAPEDCSPVPQIPVELHPILVEYVKLQVMDSMGDNEAFARASRQFDVLANDLFELLQDRDDGSPRKAVNAGGLWSFAPTRFWRF